MSLALYMDQHVPKAITVGLRLRNVDVLTAYEDGASLLADSELLDRATAHGRVLFSQDTDLVAEAACRQRLGIPFSGNIYAHQRRVSIGQCVEELTFLLRVGMVADFTNQAIFLPP